jgi:hypothetical protein
MSENANEKKKSYHVQPIIYEDLNDPLTVLAYFRQIIPLYFITNDREKNIRFLFSFLSSKLSLKDE